MHPEALCSLHEGTCHINESTNEMERKSYQIEKNVDVQEDFQISSSIEMYTFQVLAHKMITA